MFANDHLVNISTQTFYNSSQFRNIKKKWYPSLVKFTEKKNINGGKWGGVYAVTLQLEIQ